MIINYEEILDFYNSMATPFKEILTAQENLKRHLDGRKPEFPIIVSTDEDYNSTYDELVLWNEELKDLQDTLQKKLNIIHKMELYLISITPPNQWVWLPGLRGWGNIDSAFSQQAIGIRQSYMDTDVYRLNRDNNYINDIYKYILVSALNQPVNDFPNVFTRPR